MDIRLQAVTGVVPPELAEARIREVWPSVARAPGIAALGKSLTRTIVLAPLAWMLMAMVYFGKVLPVFARRYELTNRRLVVRKGWSGKISEEIPLDKIDDVELVTDANTEFFRAATLRILSAGKEALTLPGVPDPESFRQAIINACNAWVPGRSKSLPFVAASAK
ncbi:MAG: PH domain-containing protein [Gemmataceae bacterium]|nr:PH domain-containing protein [Gemmataceae bacterium]MCI0740420.1 PH domain-containing protein [Gemmataceae bacterium]